MKKILRRLKKATEKPRCSFQKYQAIFKTVDGQIHNGTEYNWACREQLSCSVQEHLMTYTQCNGYLEDEFGKMYPLENIISIEWKLLEVQTITTFLPRYKVFYSDEELKKLGGL